MNAITLTTEGETDVDLVLFVGDMHINSTRGLRVPEFTTRDGKTYIVPDAIRAHLWEPWCTHWTAVAMEKAKLAQKYQRVRVFVILMGDGTDKNYHDTEGFELWLVEIHDIIDLAMRTLAPAMVKMPDGKPLVDGWIVLRGTEAHELRLGQLAEGLAEKLATRGENVDQHGKLYSAHEFRGIFQGVDVYASHHPVARSRRRHTRAQAVTRSVTDYWLGCVSPLFTLGGEMKVIGPIDHPDVMVWGHVHFDAASGQVAGCPIQGFYNPSWQLPYSFIYRLGGGRPEPVGCRWLWCSGGKWHCDRWLHTPPAIQAVRV